MKIYQNLNYFENPLTNHNSFRNLLILLQCFSFDIFCPEFQVQTETVSRVLRLNKLCFALVFSSNNICFNFFVWGPFLGERGGGVGQIFLNFLIQLEKNIFFGEVPYPIFFCKNLLVRVKLGCTSNFTFLGLLDSWSGLKVWGGGWCKPTLVFIFRPSVELNKNVGYLKWPRQNANRSSTLDDHFTNNFNSMFKTTKVFSRFPLLWSGNLLNLEHLWFFSKFLSFSYNCNWLWKVMWQT